MDERLPISAVIVAPTYDNAVTVVDVVERCLAQGLPLILVNDGSRDDTAARIAAWHAAHPEARLEVLTHEVNQGKAAALQTGFRRAIERGFTHAITMDTDGQLDPEQIGSLLEAAARHPHALVVGARDERADDYPARSRIGRRLSNLAIRMESGVRVADSQCGFRVYPLALIEQVTCRSGRFGFEAEIVTRAGWARFEVVNVPVRCRYEVDGRVRVTHFKPGRDSLRGIRLHGALLLERMRRRSGRRSGGQADRRSG